MIVVIAILSAIGIVSYIGVTDNAIEATLKTELSNMSKQLELYKVEHNDVYPSSSQFIKDCTSTQASDSSNFCYKFNDDYVFDYRISTSLDDYTLIITNSGKHKAAFKTKDGSPTMASGKNLLSSTLVTNKHELWDDKLYGEFPAEISTTYTLSFDVTTLNSPYTVYTNEYLVDYKIFNLTLGKNSTTFTTKDVISTDNIRQYVAPAGWLFLKNGATSTAPVISHIQLELGSTVTSWEPYIPMFHE